MAVMASEMFAMRDHIPKFFGALIIDENDLECAESILEGGFDAICETGAIFLVDFQAIDDELNLVLGGTRESWELGRFGDFAIDAEADEAGLDEFFEAVGHIETTLDGEGSDEEELRVGFHPEDRLNDFLGGLGSDRVEAGGAVHLAETGEEDAEVVVDFGDRTDGASRGVSEVLLFEGDSGGESFDAIEDRFRHLSDELSGVATEAFDEASLSFGVDGFESEAGFSATAWATEDRHLVQGESQVDMLEVVHGSAADDEGGLGRGFGGFGAKLGFLDRFLGGVIFFEGNAGVGFFDFDKVLGSRCSDDLTAGSSPFGTEVDDPIGGLDQIEVMFDDDDRIPAIDETLEDLKEHGDVGEMETGGGFVQDVEGFAGIATAEFFSEFDALGFATGEGRGGLAEFEIIETHVVKGLKFLGDFGDGGEVFEGLLDIEIEAIGDRFAFELDLEGFEVEAFPFADGAGDPDIGHEFHGEFDGTVSFASAAAALVGIEAKAAGLVAADFGIGEEGEEVAYFVEDFDIGGGIAAWGAADGALIDIDDLIDLFMADDTFVGAGFVIGAGEDLSESR